MGKIKNEQQHVGLGAGCTSIRDFIVMLKLRHHVTSQHIQDFWKSISCFPIQNEVFSGEQEKESIIRVRVG